MSELIKTADLRSKSIDELSVQLVEQKESRFKERMQLVTGASQQIHEGRNTRVNIARIKTVINEKRREAAGESK